MISKPMESKWIRRVMGLICAGIMVAALGCSQQPSAQSGDSSRSEGAASEQEQAKLGVTLRETNGKVFITNVQAKSAAESAGLQQGDEVLAANGSEIDSTDKLQSQVRDAGQNGGKLTLKVRRDNDEQTLQADVEPAAEQQNNAAGKTAGSEPSSTSQNDSSNSVASANSSDPASADDNASSANDNASASGGTRVSASKPIVGDENEAAETENSPAEKDPEAKDPEAPQAADAENNDPAGAESETGQPQNAADPAATSTSDDNQDPAEAESDSGTNQTPGQETPESAEPSPDAQQEPGQASTSDQDPDDKNLIASSDRNLEITLEEVEQKLQEAKATLDGFVSQQNKLQYEKKMQSQLNDFDKRVAMLQSDIEQMKEALAEKQQHLEQVRKKREALVAEMEQLDPTTSDSWAEKQKRIDAAWESLQEAYQNPQSARQDESQTNGQDETKKNESQAKSQDEASQDKSTRRPNDSQDTGGDQ